MSFSVTHTLWSSPPFFGSKPKPKPKPFYLSFRSYRIAVPLPHASGRPSQRSQGGDNFVDDRRTWRHPIAISPNDDDEEDDDESDEEDRSLDLLVRFIENVFKKVSKRAKKAVRSVLPFPISTQLVGFSVNGILMLTFLWILKAFLQVVCTLGSVVFVSILLIRGIWSGVSFLQESRNQRVDELDEQHRAWSGVQPVT